MGSTFNLRAFEYVLMFISSKRIVALCVSLGIMQISFADFVNR